MDYKDLELPIGGRMRGVKEFMNPNDPTTAYTKINKESFLVQSIRHEDDGIHAANIVSRLDSLGLINQYTLCFDVNFENTPSEGDVMGLFQTMRQTKEGNFVADGGA